MWDSEIRVRRGRGPAFGIGKLALKHDCCRMGCCNLMHGMPAAVQSPR